jgi:protein involved in polysaccharide export with SLBB domain
VLYYLDRAGGIDVDRGSYLEVEVLRGNQTRLKVDLYKFLLTGKIDEIQLHDGDTIVAGPRLNTIPVYGNVSNPYQFEIPQQSIKASDLMNLAKPLPGSTHLSVVRAVGLERRSYYYPIGQIGDITLEAGDEVTVTADQYPTSVLIHVNGAQMGEHNFVLPLGARIRDLLPHLTPSPTADLDALQLFRPAVAAKQKQSLDNTLNALQTAALTARNSTLTEAQARQTESTMIMQFIDRAKSIVPMGQVVMASKSEVDDTLLQDGDTLVVPERTNLVSVSGEVQLPNTLVWAAGRETDAYVALVGGFTMRADRSRVLLMRQNGAVAPHGAIPEPGDEIMVLPVIETKYIEVASGITSILYQLAVAARVLTTF